MWEKVKGFVSAHPWGTAAIVFVVGIVLIYWFRGSGGSAQPAVSNLGPYYNAQAASQAAGASVYDAQIQANAATSIAATNADRDIKLAGIAAGVSNNRIGSDTTLGSLQLADAFQLGSRQIDATVQLGAQSNDRAIAASHDAYWAHRSDNETAIAINTSNNGVTSLHDTLAAQTTQQGQTLAEQLAHFVAGTSADTTRYLGALNTQATLYNTYTAGNTASINASRDVAVAGLAQLPNYAQTFINGGYSPDYASYDIANLFLGSNAFANVDARRYNADYPSVQSIQLPPVGGSAGYVAPPAPQAAAPTFINSLGDIFKKAA